MKIRLWQWRTKRRSIGKPRGVKASSGLRRKARFKPNGRRRQVSFRIGKRTTNLYANFTSRDRTCFGSDHISGTIMRESIAFFLKVVDSNLSWANYGHDYLFHINQQRMILPPVEQMYDFPGKLGFHSDNYSHHSSAEDVFTLLTGRKPIGPIRARLPLQKSLYDTSTSRALNWGRFFSGVGGVPDSPQRNGRRNAKLSMTISLECKYPMSTSRGTFGFLLSTTEPVDIHGTIENQNRSDTSTHDSRKYAERTSFCLKQRPDHDWILDQDNTWKSLFQVNLVYSAY